MKRFLPSLFVLALTVPALSHAHDAWIVPSSTVLSGDQAHVTVDAAIGNDKFHFNHRPLSLNNLQITSPGGKEIEADNTFSGELRSGFDVNLTETGTYQIALVTNGGVFARWKEGEQGKRWFGSAADFADKVPADAQDLIVVERANRVETFVTKGKPSEIASIPTGIGLVAVTHPNDLFANEEATFILTIDGKPAPQLDVEIGPGDNRYRDTLDEIKVKTNDKGEFSVTWPHAGRYWVHARASDDKTTVKQASSRALSYSATFEVLPE